MSKYFLIQYRSEYVYNDDQKIVVKSIKDAINYAKKELEFLRDEYMLKPQRWEQDCVDYKDKFRYVHKRFRISDMYVDKKDGTSRKCGKVISITGRPKDDCDDIEDDLISAWVTHIPNSRVKYLAGFEEIE